LPKASGPSPIDSAHSPAGCSTGSDVGAFAVLAAAVAGPDTTAAPEAGHARAENVDADAHVDTDDEAVKQTPAPTWISTTKP